jgi:DNA-binding transcriptional MerR regulator
MLELSAATIRTWETRYGNVVPERSGGGQRLYSREQVDQLRFVKEQIAAGRRPAEAHRLLAERSDVFAAEPLRVLLAESRLGAVELLRQLLGSEGFEVVLATDADTAGKMFDELAPALVVIDTDDADFESLAARLRAAGTKILPVDLLKKPLALLDKARSELLT